MTRLSKVPKEQWDKDLQVMFERATALEQCGAAALAHAPEFAKAMMVFTATLMRSRTLPRRLVELLRLRVAFHNQCRSCMAIRYKAAFDDGLTKEAVCSLEKPSESPDLTDAEKAAIAYADIASTNHFAIDDSTFDDLRKYFTERQIVELGMFVANFIGFGRMAASWDMVEELPISLQDKSTKAAPWTHESIMVGA
jgi:AhpD family alkylhydroperoxidase